MSTWFPSASIHLSCKLVLHLLLLAVPASVSAECVSKRWELPVLLAGRQPLVSAQINGASVHLLLDSGASRSQVTVAAVRQLGLSTRRIRDRTQLVGLGGAGAGVPALAHVTQFALEGRQAQGVDLLVRDNDVSDDAVGVLGLDLVGRADLEFDLGGAGFTLAYPGSACRRAIMPDWEGVSPVVRVPLIFDEEPWGNAARIEVLVNGVPLRAQLDTGAEVSILTRAAARRVGLEPGGKGVREAPPVTGLGTQLVRTWLGGVDRLEIGGERIRDTHLRLGDFALEDTDLLLGMDFFLAHRLLVANSQGVLYVRYQGGPVFDRPLPDQPAQADRVTVDGQGPVRAILMQPLDADGFARRARIFAAEGALSQAIDDLSEASRLAPGVADHWLQRALMRSALAQWPAALLDLDQALMLEPGNVAALVTRARLRIAHPDLQSAKPVAPDAHALELAAAGQAQDASALALASADLAQADRHAAAQAPVRLDLGDLYLRLGAPAAAIVQFDDWLAARPQGVNVPAVLNQRCWARALLGVQLEAALSDCNQALAADPHSASRLDSRGLVHLRRGDWRLALDDYQAALSLNPALPWSLYGSGLILLRRGAAAAAQADLTAARLLRPDIDREAQRYGIVAQMP